MTCAASNDQANTREVEGNCPGDSKCIQRNGVNQFNEDVTDIFCVDRTQVREWLINAKYGPKPITECSAGFNNNGQRTGSVELITNVLDSTQHNLISPADNYFEISGVRVGKSAANGIVDSGLFNLRAHSAVQVSFLPQLRVCTGYVDDEVCTGLCDWKSRADPASHYGAGVRVR